jgi:hypothetical protein
MILVGLKQEKIQLTIKNKKSNNNINYSIKRSSITKPILIYQFNYHIA